MTEMPPDQVADPRAVEFTDQDPGGCLQVSMVLSLPSATGWGWWDIDMPSCQELRGKTACPGPLNHLNSAVRKVSFASGNTVFPFQFLSHSNVCHSRWMVTNI